MAKLVVNIKGQSEEFGLTDDVRDIGGNDYLTISNGNKKQYARLGSSATKLIIRKNNQKFYVQKDAIYFPEKQINYWGGKTTSDVYFPVGDYFISGFNKTISVLNSDWYKVIFSPFDTDNGYYSGITIMHGNNIIYNKTIYGIINFSIKRI